MHINALPRMAVVISLCAAVWLLGIPAMADGVTTGVVPVANCDTTFGVTGQEAPWHPQSLPTTLVSKVRKRLTFYSNGFSTVLAPKRWACAGVQAADGSSSLSVYPAGSKAPTAGDTKASSVTITTDYTGHGPGAQLVCSYFPNSTSASATPDCPALPKGARLRFLTADIAEVREKSGADTVAIYPQVSDASTVNVTLARCKLPKRNRSLCSPILADVIAREFPASPTPTTTTTAAPATAPPATEPAASPSELPCTNDVVPAAIAGTNADYTQHPGWSWVKPPTCLDGYLVADATWPDAGEPNNLIVLQAMNGQWVFRQAGPPFCQPVGALPTEVGKQLGLC